MPIVTTLVGALLGMILGRGFDGAFAGGFLGLIAGLVFSSWRKSRGAATSRASALTVARDATADTATPSPQPGPSIPAYAASRGAHATSAAREPSALWRWITGGNMLARVGVVVLFIGVAFLLKYATEHVSVPIEVRLAAVALGGIVLLVLGWRLR